MVEKDAELIKMAVTPKVTWVRRDEDDDSVDDDDVVNDDDVVDGDW